MAGKKLKEALTKVEHEKLYQPQEAVDLLKQIAFAKFDETVEVHLRTGVDPRHADQVIRSSVALPAGTGKTRRVVAFAQGDKVREAEEAGADVVGGEDLVQRIQGGWLDFDVAVATPNKNKVGTLSRAKVRSIAETKMADLNANTIESAMRMVEGTARSMGVEISG